MAKAGTKLPIKSEKKSAAKPAAATPSAWSHFDSLRQEIDRLFDEFGTSRWHLPFSRPSRLLDIEWPSRADWQIAPAMDLVEKDGSFEISAELPGIDEKNVEVKLSDGMLTIKGEKTEEKEEHDKEYHMSERRFGSFQRSFQLPDSVDVDKISANFAKGVLTITMPKSAEAKKAARKIDVKAG